MLVLALADQASPGHVASERSTVVAPEVTGGGGVVRRLSERSTLPPASPPTHRAEPGREGSRSRRRARRRAGQDAPGRPALRTKPPRRMWRSARQGARLLPPPYGYAGSAVSWGQSNPRQPEAALTEHEREADDCSYAPARAEGLVLAPPPTGHVGEKPWIWSHVRSEITRLPPPG